MASRLDYYRRVILANGIGVRSHRSFWHEVPEVNPAAFEAGSTAYYMTFAGKADYEGPFDGQGVPLLDYRGSIGRQYNPIAIAQYGLGSYNRCLQTGEEGRKQAFLRQADWLVQNLEPNQAGVMVWHHHFDWHYRERLKAPWYSALAQGSGVSLLVRAYFETGRQSYRDAAAAAFASLQLDVDRGGTAGRDDDGYLWLEEYLVQPPSHILNGMIWAAWGIHDYATLGGEPRAQALFLEAVRTLVANLHRYDTGFWSCYELRPGRVPMVASQFYHQLHVTQLDVMDRLTGEEAFGERAVRWKAYQRQPLKRWLAKAWRAAFKILWY